MFDTAVFKVLAHNDTGAAAGHQGGIVIPKDIEEFFPPLPATTDLLNPTVDIRLLADLFVNGRRVDQVETRFQHQTWGGTRSPERRLTDNLGALRNLARKDDIVLFTKDLSDDRYIQVHLVTQGTAEYLKIVQNLNGERWGPLDPKDPPVTRNEIAEAEHYLTEQEHGPATAFDKERTIVETRSVRRARDRAFRRRVLAQYDFSCAFTGRKFLSPPPSVASGVDAAHVVPVADNGSDHPANGLPLTKELHWSFDRGLIGVDAARKVFVPESVRIILGNEFLRDLHGAPIREAAAAGCCVLDEAFAWHRENVLIA